MPDTPFRNEATAAPEAVAAAVVIALAAFLRFYNLDTPSMWPDELLVAVVAQHPVTYILEWARRLEVHPPGFHLLIKLASQAGDSDIALRFVSAACGTATVAMLWRLGRKLLPPGVAVLAASLAASSALLVWVSRQVRPYGVLVLCLTASLYFLVRFLTEGRRRDMWLLLAANLPVLWLHYLAILVVGAQGAAWLALKALRRTPVTWRQAAAFAGLTAVSFLPALPFFLAMLGHRDMTTPRPFDACLAATVDNFRGVLDFFRLPFLTGAMAALAVLGAVSALTARRTALVVCCLALILAPLGAVLAARYGTFYFSSHLSFMAIPVSLLAAAGLGVLLRPQALRLLAAVVLALSLGGTLMVRDGAKLYDIDSTIITWWHFGTFKSIARQFQEVVPPGDVVLFTDDTVRAYTGWYLDRFTDPDPIREQRLSPDRQNADLSLVTLKDDLGHLRETPASLAARPDFIGAARLDSLDVRRFRIPRQPTVIAALPTTDVLTAAPFDFYARIRETRGLVIDPFRGCALFPAGRDRPGSAVMRYELAPGLPAVSAQVVCEFTSEGVGSRIRLLAASPAQPERQVAEHAGPGGGVLTAAIPLTPGTPWLDLRLELTNAEGTPVYSVDNLKTLRVRRLTTAFCPTADIGPCAVTASQAINRALLEQFEGESFRVLPVARQETDLGDAAGREDSAPESGGFAHLAPKEATGSVRVRVTARDVGEGTIFYPRLGGEDARVTVRRVAADGRREVIFALTGPAKGWTPVSAQYRLPLPAKGPLELEIELEGRGAQLWHDHGAVLFRR